jgi:hypothetical protein
MISFLLKRSKMVKQMTKESVNNFEKCEIGYVYRSIGDRVI